MGGWRHGEMMMTGALDGCNEGGNDDGRGDRDNNDNGDGDKRDNGRIGRLVRWWQLQ